MANLVDTSVNGDLRVTGTMFGTQAGNYATCATAGGTAAKAVTISGFTLTTGIHVFVKFSENNSAAVGSLTLNVSGTGAKSIKCRGGNNLGTTGSIAANGIYEFVYDGTNWEMVGSAVTGVKGANESSYRWGNVNLTAENVGAAASSHSHGNIANGGTLTDTAAAAAGNDYVVIRDADNAKIQTSTIKGTDVADAVSKKHSHSTLTLSTTAQAYDGSNTLALPSSDPYTSARTPTSHASSATTYGVGTTANYGHVKLDNSTPLGVTNSNADGVATGKGHKHNNIESVARASVTTVDLDHVNTNNRAHMILSQVSSSTSTTHDPGDGYMLTFMWDTNDPYDAQLYIPVDSTRDWGRIKIRYRDNNSSGWGDWGYIRLAATSSILYSSNNLDNVKGSAAGQILSYNWSTNSVPTNAPVSSETSMMLVYQPHASYCYQAVITAQNGIYRRICKNGTWTAWTKDLDAADITTGTANGTISVAGTDVAVKGLGGAAYLNTGTASGTVATGNHTHTTSIAEDTGTATVTLAHNKTYKLTSGGTSVIFKTPTDSDANTIPSAYCETAAGTAAKTASCTNYTATPDTYLHVLIRYANTSAGALTLNVNGQGAKPIYINGAVSSSSNYTLPAGTYIAYYDGTNYWLRTDGKLQAAITGTAGFADAVYNRSNQTGDGWFKLAETKLQPRTNSDNTAIWDVALAVSGGGIAYEKICLDVRFNSSGDGVVSRFVRTYEADWTGSVKFAVLVSGQGGSGNTQVQLWAWQNQAWRGISIRQAAGNNWSLSKYNNSAWTYYSGDTGGTSKPVADATNHISVTDSTNVHMRAASFISTGTLPVARGGTGITTSTNVNAVVIGNSTTATNAMQTVRTGNGAFYATAQDAKPQFGTLPAAQGGTGKTSAKDACNSFINALDTGSSTPVDADYYVSQYVSGGTTTTTYHRRPMSALWTYIKGKMTSDTGVNISGNAATATSATSASSASKVANKLTLKIKTGTTEGTDLYTYDGSGAKTLDIKQGSNITLTAAAGSLTIAGTADTKVTSAANHYAPTTASGEDKTASASGATAAWSIDVVKGVTLNTDGKGHVTGLSVTSGKIPGNPNTDTKVKATAKTDDANYKILATASASPTSGNATEAVYDADISLNPSTNTISANISGNAATASKINTSAKIGDTNKPVYITADGTVTPISYTIATSVPSGAVFTDTKVTSSGNHYTPATSSGSEKTASASGATAAWSIDVVKGITISTDGKGHITDLAVTSGKIPANPGDTKVTQSLITTSGSYPVILKNSTTATDSPTSTVNYGAKITANPSTGQLHATTFDVNSKCTLQFNTTTNALDFVFA